MMDPDAPSRKGPQYCQFRHLVVGIVCSIRLCLHILGIHLRLDFRYQACTSGFDKRNP
ncbi:hypothetical protein BDM02DRAFT_3116717 [Thelephora ganbajun]|uniref:Uncharacterized protein n=1 Tax=Thelephora ganbajun TaxID=370292 RepID=A0ACB6ZDK4_THEGA|nr:hypothetical protein BDM02DRAFT_3116717 [Thelephora ganbajun]